MAIFIKHVEGSKIDQLESFDKDQIRIGRQLDNDINFDPQKDISVSGYHAEIYRDGEAFFIKDLQSRNGTFVNSRKINQPVPLKEGDILQFSARGPKVVFSTRDPSVDSSAAFTDAPGDVPTQVFTAEEKDTLEKKPGVWEKIRPRLPIASAALALLALVGGGLYLGFSWWALLIVAAVILPLAGGAYLGWVSWQKRKALAERQEVVREEREGSLGGGNRNNLQDLRRKWAEVVRSLKNSKLQSLADDPIYALPWFVVMGEPGSGKSSLIKASGPFSSVVTPGQEGPTRNCDWWFFDKTLILDTSGRYVFQAKGSDSAQEWQELLNLLQTNRRKEPVNGVLITVPADSLALKPVDKLKEEAAQLRERVDEMVQRLGVRFPVYLTISKCDLIAGFTEFFEALPDQVKSQALGCVNSDSQNTDASRFFDRAYRNICERAQRLRLALLNEEEKTAVIRGMFVFPAELQCLHAPLKAFIDVFFRPSPYRDMPLFRGLFLASARQVGSPSSPLSRSLGLNYAHLPPTGTSRDFFLRDIFSVILPNDRALVGHTAVARERSQLTRAAGLIIAVAASLLLCGIFTLSFTNNWLALSSLDLRLCIKAGGSKDTLGQVLRPLDECRQSIEDLTPRSILRRIAFNFGLGEAARVGSALKSRFLALFRASVMNPLDNRIDDSLAKRSTASFVVGSIIKRLDLLARCQEGGNCGDMEKSNGMNYRVLLALAEPRVQEGDPGIERLRRGYESYLLWQTDPKAYAQMYEKDLERVNGWVRGGLDEKSILESVKSQFTPINATDLWGVSDPLRVDAPYTARAWREGIDPLISGLRKFSSESKDVSHSVKRFEVDYRDEALRQWGEFLSEFPRVEKLAFQSGITPQRALLLAGPESPYTRAIDMAYANLSVILGNSWEASDLPSWLVTLKKYVALRSKIAEMQKAGKQVAEEKGLNKEPGFLTTVLQAFSQRQQKSVSEEKDLSKSLGFLATYLETLSQLRAELSSTANSYESSKKAFVEGGPSEKATHPILKASWAHRMLRESIGSVNKDDGRFWILLERPIVLGWQAMLGETGKYLQQQWETLRGEVIGQEDFRTGTDKMYAFATKGPAAPFLDERGRKWVRKELLEQSVPFREEFLDYLFRYRLYSTQGSPSQTALVPAPPAFIVRTF